MYFLIFITHMMAVCVISLAMIGPYILEALYYSQQLNINYYSIISTNAHHILEELTVCMSSAALIVV